ncbi:hypothetical protein F4861DRAFT_185006 [Xylaria intraflava]|nr:hypothetical protein F4861DRAFT_185006 [Xylaria intraflava]
MTRRSHHRSRSSIDRVLDLLTELDDDQMELLLREAESTVSGNVAVSEGINFFERPGVSPMEIQPPTPSSPPRRTLLTSLSPRKQSEIRRRLSKRLSSQQDTSAGHVAHLDSIQSSKKTPRAYKRISRPIFSLPPPVATADLIELLAAYLMDASATPTSSASSTTLSSPTTPRSLFSPFTQPENEGPELDLLEPPPVSSIFGNPMKEPARNISGIFEVLDDAALPAQRL